MRLRQARFRWRNTNLLILFDALELPLPSNARLRSLIVPLEPRESWSMAERDELWISVTRDGSGHRCFPSSRQREPRSVPPTPPVAPNLLCYPSRRLASRSLFWVLGSVTNSPRERSNTSNGTRVSFRSPSEVLPKAQLSLMANGVFV